MGWSQNNSLTLYKGVMVIDTLNLLILQHFQGTFTPLFMNNSG